jgi:S-adenosylmethionine:tRNA ribosyltransferase-isomerase
METKALDYDLPNELIAQEAIEPRDAARLLVAKVASGAPEHRHIRDLPGLLRRGDLLVLNRTKVIPARLHARKETGGEVEVLLIHPEQDHGDAAGAPTLWRTMIRGRVNEDTRLTFQADGAAVAEASVLAVHDDGTRTLEFPAEVDVAALAERIGRVPLPPYIDRADRADDKTRYQTVYAEKPGSVAAPTAGLHLTTALLEAIAAQGVDTALVELHIGPGTFKPIDTDHVEDFRIHAERCVCPQETVDAIAACRARGGRVIAVGTTVVRTLETAAEQPNGLAKYSGWTSLYLRPPRQLRAVDGLLTNFHLPRSSLLLAVACLTGVDRLLELYRAAVAERYRFLSYGDAMLLMP